MQFVCLFLRMKLNFRESCKTRKKEKGKSEEAAEEIILYYFKTDTSKELYHGVCSTLKHAWIDFIEL